MPNGDDARWYRDALIPRYPRFTPRERREQPWHGSIVALDTEGTADTGKFTATAQWDQDGETPADRFTEPEEFAEFLIERSRQPGPILCYFHNLEWDLGVMIHWLGKETRLRYESHTSRRNGSALFAIFDYEGRPKHARKIMLRDSFAIWSMSLEKLGQIVGLPKLRTPRRFLPRVVDAISGEWIDNPADFTDAPTCELHGLTECWQCYDLRDAAILHKAMWLYVDECNVAGVPPSLTRAAHAMKEFRTNYMPDAMWQYTERENLRALESRHGGRSEVHHLGLCVAGDDEVIVQADVNSQYPYAMSRGGFPDAGHSYIYHRTGETFGPANADKLRHIVGWAWAEVNLPTPPPAIGPLLWQDARTGAIQYPTRGTLQGCWTTEELSYAASLGCSIRITVMEGTPVACAIDPFSTFIADKWAARALHKSTGDPRSESDKLTMNGLAGKFGMRWSDPILRFRAITDPDIYQSIGDAWCERADELPHRYPDFIMVPWNALITARGRIMLHRFGMTLLQHGATLLACDTDSWTFLIAKDELARLPDIGEALGEWKIEGRWHAFYGAAPKEYALYPDSDALAAHRPGKYRAKGIGATPDRQLAVDHYLWTGDVHFQRPQKTRGVLRGAPAATFLPVHKHRHAPPALPLRMLHSDWPAEVTRRRSTAGLTLWDRRQDRDTPVTAMTAATV